MDLSAKALLIVFCGFVASAFIRPTACAQVSPFSLDAAGSRWGFSTSKKTHDFNQAEGFLDWRLPITLDVCTKWHFLSGLEFSAGWLRGRGEDAFITTFSPCLLVKRDSIPLSLDLGGGLSLLSQEQFGSRDFGTVLQFSSHAGLNFDFGKHVRLGYRFQHMSNAHLSDYNPGLNLHLFGISYRF